MAFVGCGTAKCGSTSLWHLLHDSGVDCKHERHLIGHEFPKATVKSFLKTNPRDDRLVIL